MRYCVLAYLGWKNNFKGRQVRRIVHITKLWIPRPRSQVITGCPLYCPLPGIPQSGLWSQTGSEEERVNKNSGSYYLYGRDRMSGSRPYRTAYGSPKPSAVLFQYSVNPYLFDKCDSIDYKPKHKLYSALQKRAQRVRWYASGVSSVHERLRPPRRPMGLMTGYSVAIADKGEGKTICSKDST